MFIDDLFFSFITELRFFPSILISCVNFLVCLGAIYFLNRKFGYAGLCSYMVIASVSGNIQVLYATTYEILNMEVLLGTIIFCSTFLVCDIINSEYGAQKARSAVYLTIIMDVFFLACIILTLGHKPIDYTKFSNFGISKSTIQANISAMQQIFLPIPRILIASYAAYLISQISEIFLYNLSKRISVIRSQYVKHNVSLFISSVCVDTAVFTLIGMCILAPEPLNATDFWQICTTAVIIRSLCNLANSGFIKIIKNDNKL